ncbi:MAG TPA: lysophospholipid acyltransferase family protein [Candidatus Eisenbacteria bacterium]|nr:lysophospholipid acyltransferase family protein [Candidatus Eisenbacteria bacterium]
MARHETPDLQDRVEAVALTLLLGTLRLPGGQWAGRQLGRFVSRWVPIRREVALINLRASFPEKSETECRAIYGRMCELLGITLAEFARFSKPHALTRRITIENVEAVDRALRAGKGALLVTAHFGNWEVLGGAVAARGYPMTAVGARQRNPLVEELFNRYRQNVGMVSINVDKNLKPLLQALHEGACVATLADQDGGPDGFFLPFLGRTASVQGGLFRLLARKGIPMVTGFSIREGDRWRGELQDPEFPEPSEDTEREAARLAAVYAGRVESYVRRYPDHWFWLHRRWRTRPPSG